jgi:hypothetical protein
VEVKKVSYSQADSEMVNRIIENIIEKVLLERLSATEQLKTELVTSKYLKNLTI